MFERITQQMLVECEDSQTEWQQAWWNEIPSGATEPVRDEDAQDCYDLAWHIIHNYLERNKGLGFQAAKACSTATYNFDTDEVNCPCRLQFDCDADFFCTIFHELIHSTGHISRLARPGFSPTESDGEYNQEELIAELGSMFLCGICCYNSGKVFEQSSAYIKNYKMLTGSSNEDLMQVAREALRAVRFLVGNFED